MQRILTTPTDTDHAYRLAVQTIGAKEISDTMGQSIQHIYRMAAEKKHCCETRNTPFTQAYKLGKKMIKENLRNALFIGISPIVNLLNCKMVPLESKPDKDLYHEEMVDLNCAVSDLMETAGMYLRGEATEYQVREHEFSAYDAVGQFTEKALQEKRK